MACSERCLRYSTCIVVLILTIIPWTVSAQVKDNESDITRLKALSIEELLNLEVTSVSRGPQRLSEVASAIQVITREDILRSGATNIPEALRLATNLQVAQLNSNAYIISARGFNTVFANKLLVLIDGRSVYTPLFGGVLWEMQHVLLEDVEQIEVISGPGGTMWGANAVNGVINIITKKAKGTQGVYLSAASSMPSLDQAPDREGKAFRNSDFLKRAFAARYGTQLSSTTFLRVHAQHTSRNSSFSGDTARNADEWDVTEAGFNMSMSPDSNDVITIQGSVYLGTKDRDGNDADFDGQHILGRWTRTTSEKSQFSLQAYFDRYYRDDPGATADELVTVDLDFQHRYHIGKSNSLLWGLGYRHVEDHVINRSNIGLLPAYRTMPLYTAFLQNETIITPKVKLTIGSKFQHNVFTGTEFQPSVRMSANINSKNTVWAAVSEAVRTPSRMDVDYYLFLPPGPAIVKGDIQNFVSERLKAFEFGYRMQAADLSSVSIAGFYNEYRDVYSVEFIADGTLRIMNGSEAETWGGEFSGLLQATDSWRLRGGFTYIDNSLRPKAGRNHNPSYLVNDVKHQFMVQSMLNITDNIQFDLVARYLDYIPASFATIRVPEYFTFDARLAFVRKALEVAIIGQNLKSKVHREFGAAGIPRSVYAKVACRF
jgi:iron complex outermembrane recepter protein